jgi:hypothetical protein
MYREPEAMREIHEIRERLHEEEKNLSMNEKLEKTHREAQEIIKKYGVKLKFRANRMA